MRDEKKCPLVSIIIPVYNGEKYIESVKKSIDNQSFQDFEVIFVNDGSTDESYAVLKKIAADDEKCIVIDQPNKGVSAARNRGLESARGEYVTFVDVDDQLHPLFLEIMIERIKDNTILSICKSGDHVEVIDKEKINILVKPQKELLENFLYGVIRTGVWGIVVEKKVLSEHNLYFEEGFKYSEDLHMVWRMLCHTKKAVIIEAPLYIYNIVENSAMTKMNDSRFDSLRLISNLDLYIKRECPEFYPQFHAFAVPKMAWSLMWQAARFLNYSKFEQFIQKYDFKTDMKKLKTFPQKKVALSAEVFLYSQRIYYILAKAASFKYRR